MKRKKLEDQQLYEMQIQSTYLDRDSSEAATTASAAGDFLLANTAQWSQLKKRKGSNRRKSQSTGAADLHGSCCCCCCCCSMMESALSDPSCSRDLLLLEPVLKAGSTELLRLQAQFENDAADSDLICAEQHLANLADSPISGIDDSDRAAAVARTTTTTPDSFLAKLGEIGTSTAVPPNWKKQLCKVELQESANELQGLRFVSCVPAEVQLPDHPREESTSTHHEYIIESNAAGIILRKQKDPQLGVIDILHRGTYSPQLENSNSNSKGLLQLDLGLVTRFHEAAEPLRSRRGAAGRLIRKRKREEACEDEEWLELGLSTRAATPSAAIENFCSSTLAGSENNHQHRNSGLQIMSESAGEEMHPHEHEQDFSGQQYLHHSPVQTARIENLLDLFDTLPGPRSQPITAICSGGRMLLQTTTSLQSPKNENAIQLSWRDHVLQKREQLISCQEDPWQKLLLQSCVGNNVQQLYHTEEQPVHPVVSSSNLPEKHREESREMMMNSDPVPWSDPSGNSSCAPPQETSRTTSARGGDRNRELWFTLRAAAAENR